MSKKGPKTTVKNLERIAQLYRESIPIIDPNNKVSIEDVMEMVRISQNLAENILAEKKGG